MNSIELKNIGKRFGTRWLFEGVEAKVNFGESCAIVGANGSGKSTLMQVIAGFLRASEGEVVVQLDGQIIEREKIYQQLVLAAPHTDLLMEFTLEESLQFHAALKPIRNIYKENISEMANFCYLQEQLKQPLHQFSSGMLQRLKLGLAFLTDVPLLLLDEPCSNLDEAGKQWYHDKLMEISSERIVFIASNEPSEYRNCNKKIIIEKENGSIKS